MFLEIEFLLRKCFEEQGFFFPAHDTVMSSIVRQPVVDEIVQIFYWRSLEYIKTVLLFHRCRQLWRVWCLCADRVYIPVVFSLPWGRHFLLCHSVYSSDSGTVWLPHHFNVIWTKPEMTWVTVVCFLALLKSIQTPFKIVWVSRLAWCFERPHMVKDKPLFFVRRLPVTNTDRGRRGVMTPLCVRVCCILWSCPHRNTWW